MECFGRWMKSGICVPSECSIASENECHDATVQKTAVIILSETDSNDLKCFGVAAVKDAKLAECMSCKLLGICSDVFVNVAKVNGAVVVTEEITHNCFGDWSNCPKWRDDGSRDCDFDEALCFHHPYDKVKDTVVIIWEKT